MKRIPLYAMLLAGMTIGLSSCKNGVEQLSLAGQWQCALDSTVADVADIHYNNTILLPGTTDDAGLGTPCSLQPSLKKPQILHLTRKHSYVGPAWYSREVVVPKEWMGKKVELNLERVIWQSKVWIDGKPVASPQESLVTPHVYDLTGLLAPGKHTITICIDNRKRYDISVNDMAHAYTNETQIMWNGVIGDISLRAKDVVSIDNMQVYPDAQTKTVKVSCTVDNGGGATNGKCNLTIEGSDGQLLNANRSVSLVPGINKIDFTLPVEGDVKEWSEFSPTLYKLRASINAGRSKDQEVVDFGFRRLERKGSSLLLNGKEIFLRGTLECCIFPLTGYPPTNHEGWEKVFSTARAWGLNHLRFHSWCPPRAAFEVADSMGFYLQVELPLWATNLTADRRKPYLYAEADRILREYGNHPSFCFFSMGNELQYDFKFLGDLLLHTKQQDARHLYTTTSFSFEGGHGDHAEKNDDYLVTQWTKNGWVRGQGVFNAESPRFDKDYSTSTKDIGAPIITHEIGQYAVYPDMKEIAKYTGVLDPLNFKGVRDDLQKKGLLDRADDYLEASGKLATLLYKEEIERAMKTPGISGFQLLDLHDFPGQGTALVGLLNAFWESKGVTTDSAFRQFCSPVTPLARFPKAVYQSGETFEAGIEIANYGSKDLHNNKIVWKISEEGKGGKTIAQGQLTSPSVVVGGNTKVGTVRQQLNVDKARKLILSVEDEGTDYANQWPIWVYPKRESVDFGNIVVTDNPAQAEKALKAGQNVLLNPPYKNMKGLEGKFVPVFWSPVHFPAQAGTMGLLLNPAHPAFADFPTENHTDWQWWRLTTHSKTLCIDSIWRDVTPLVECVDNFANNRRLTNLFETRCLNGKLVVCSMDLLREQNNSPEVKQLLYSIVEYMKSDAFNPSGVIAFDKISGFVSPESKVTTQHPYRKLLVNKA